MKASILSVGACTPVGLTAEQTAFGMRAALFCPRTVHALDEDGRELGAVLLTSVVEEIEGWERMVWLALPALREVLAEASGVHRVFLALPARRAGFDDDDRRRVVDEMQDALEGVSITVVAGENEAFGRALALAVRHLADHPSEKVAVGAVDSRHAAATYADLDADFRILSERAPDGMIPSEGAAFVVLGAAKDADAKEGALAALVFADAVDEVARGSLGAPVELDGAFTDLVERGARSVEPGPLPWVLVDQRGERHRSRSWERVALRLNDVIDQAETTVDALSERLGDAGAASGAILCVYAAIGLASGFGPGARATNASALVALGSDGPGRACFALVKA